MYNPNERGLFISDFIYASNIIMRKINFKYLGVDMYEIPPLAQGYALISYPSSYESSELYLRIASLIRNNKTVVLERVDIRVMQVISQIHVNYSGTRIIEMIGDEPFEIKPDYYMDLGCFKDSLIFLVTDQFILRRFLHQRIQKSNILFDGQNRLPIQTVRFVGLGPEAGMLTEKVIASIKQASHVILFDRTLENIVRGIKFSGYKYVLQFVYEDFASNLLSLNMKLANLQAAGVYDVTVLIEGNPEIYDYAEGLSTVGRQFVYEVNTPLVVIGCQWLEKVHLLNFIEPSYILTSGFNLRQGITTTELVEEISTYLETDFTFMVMEMYCGDIPLVLSRIQQSERPKSVIILTNMFSPDQRVYFLPFDQMHMVDWVEKIKGRFTTLVIVDEKRLPKGSEGFERMINIFGQK